MRWILPPVTIFCLTLCVSAEVCDSIIKMADFRKLMEDQREINMNQSQVVQEMRQISRNQSEVIDRQKQIIAEQEQMMQGLNETKLIEEQRQMIEDLSAINLQQQIQLNKTAVLFMVKFNAARDFSTPNSVVKFDVALTNVGGGYVLATGKFVAPVDGDYYFLASVVNHVDNAGVNLMVNGAVHISSGNSNDGVAVAATVAHLAAGDQVWLVRPHWSSGRYEQWTSFFTGHLFH